MNYYLGIDGGGTKTHAVLIDENFNIVYDEKFEGSHIITAGDEKFVNIMSTIYDQTQKISTGNIKHIFCALAGYGEFVDDNNRIEKQLKKSFQDTPFKVLNDSVGVWAGGLLCDNGIGVIAGTGSCCCGIVDNTYYRVGGWGYLAGDEASAYWIALKAVNAYMRMFDGRMKPTILQQEIETEFNLNETTNVLDLIYRKMDRSRPQIATIAKCCSSAAEKGCEVSIQILHEAANEIFEHIQTTANKMQLDSVIPVTYTGGVFNSKIFKQKLQENFEHTKENYQLVEPITNAAVGSAIYASILAGNVLDETIRNKFRGH